MSPNTQWIQQTLVALEKRRDAFRFLERATDKFPSASPLHAESVTRLWQVSEDVDYLLYPLLEELQISLLTPSSEIATTQGASIRYANNIDLPITLADNLPHDGSKQKHEVLVYECSWSLQWEKSQKGIYVTVSIEPINNSLTATVSAKSWPIPHEICFPISDSQLKQALSECFVKESTSDELKLLLNYQTDSLAKQEYEMQQRVLQEIRESGLTSK